MKPIVYIETTVPSYYCDERAEAASEITRTRDWWDHERQDYECFISPVVIDELAAGDYPTREACLALVKKLSLLEVSPRVLDIAEAYQARGFMPRHPVADAIHLAVASFYRVDYLLTWNCRHIANANKIHQFEVLNQGMGLAIPLLVTPHMLQPWENHDES